jgi:uncharacterized repeat protein (TIGR03803 family)
MKPAQCYVIASVFVALASSADAAHINVLHDFNGLTASPGTFAFGPGGVMYGVASQGGSAGHGTIYSFDPKTGAFTVLYNFVGGADGALPVPGLVLDRDILYGATELGGPSNAGTVFSFDTKTATEHVLHSFSKSDGSQPSYGPVMAANGKLYGAAGGGSSYYGLLYEINPKTGIETIIHAFDGSDGEGPNALTLGPSGLLYGSAEGAGSNNAGTIFSFDTASNTFSFYSFSGVGNLFAPLQNMVLSQNGMLYGVTYNDLIYQFNPSSGAITAAYQFKSEQVYLLDNPLAVDAAGVVYGATIPEKSDVANNKGLIYKFDPSTGVETTLYSFKNLHVGDSPAGLTLGQGGKLYGTTLLGGPDYGGKGKPGYGMIFSIKP